MKNFFLLNFVTLLFLVSCETPSIIDYNELSKSDNILKYRWRPYTGVVKMEHENGTEFSKYLDGLKHGFSYILNGDDTTYIGNWLNGKQNGLEICFKNNGDTLTVSNYKNGLLDGFCYTYFEDLDEIETKKSFIPLKNEKLIKWNQ